MESSAQPAHTHAPRPASALPLLLLPFVGIFAVGAAFSYGQVPPPTSLPPLTGDEVVQFLRENPEMKSTMKRYDHLLELAQASGPRPFVQALVQEQKREAQAQIASPPAKPVDPSSVSAEPANTAD